MLIRTEKTVRKNKNLSFRTPDKHEVYVSFQIILFVTTLFWKKYSSSKNSESKMYENRPEKLLALSFFF